MNAYEITLSLHNILRWVVLLAGIAAAVRALVGWLGKREWTELDKRLGLLYTISLGLQFLIGLLLYLVLSPITTANFSNFGEAMSNPTTRFFLVEHTVLMLLAVGLGHMGRSLAKKAETDNDKHRRAAIFFTLSLLAVIAGIPWERPFFRLR